MSTKQEALLNCAEAFGKVLREGTVRVWMEELEEHGTEIVVRAFGEARQSFPRFPTIAAVRDLCGAAVAEQRARSESGQCLPPLDYTVEEKRSLLRQVANGERSSSRFRYPTKSAQKAAHEALETLTDEDLGQMTMPRVVMLTIPEWKGGIGRMP